MTTLPATKPTRERIVEIDTRIADISHELWRLGFDRNRKAESVHYAAGDKRIPGPKDARGRYDMVWELTTPQAAAKVAALPADHHGHYSVSEWQAVCHEITTLGQEQADLSQVWYEHRWSRFYFVTNTNGHIHKDTSCSTCYDSTEFQWLTHLSDQTEAEAVADWGKVLCSVCYPSAPTEWTDGEPLAKIVAREEAAIRKAERTAKKLEKALLPDGSTITLTVLARGTHWDRNLRQHVEGEFTRHCEITTLAQAKTWLREISDAKAEGRIDRSYAAERGCWTPENEEWVVAAIAAKIDSTPEAVAAEAKEKAEKKAKKYGY
jgi:hypothetical protein